MSTATNVTAGKPVNTGAIWRAPLGTTLPTSVDAELDEAFVQLGYASDDGVTNSNSPESDTTNAWGGDPVLTTQQEKTDEWSVTLIEAMNVDVLKAVYGSANVSGTLATGITVVADNSEPEEGAWVFDMILRGGARKRIVLPDAKISELGEISYVDDAPVGYELTLQAMPDTTGKTHYEYIKSAA